MPRPAEMAASPLPEADGGAAPAPPGREAVAAAAAALRRDSEEDLPATGTEAQARVEDTEMLFAMDRMDRALSAVQDQSWPQRGSRFSQARHAEADPLARAFADLVPSRGTPLDRGGTSPGTSFSFRGGPRVLTAVKLGIPMPGEEAQSSPVRYLHIPKHAMKDFRTFAQNAANEAIAENNPYILALNSHRAKLHPSLVDTPRTVPTRMQQLATDPGSLARLLADDGFPAEEDMPRVTNNCLPAPLSACYGSGCRMHRCEEYGCMGEYQESRWRPASLLVKQLPALVEEEVASVCEDIPEDVPEQPHTPVSSPSGGSSADSSPSVCDEIEIGMEGPRSPSRRRRHRISTVRPSGPTLLSRSRGLDCGKA